jgi:hypothetical protein
MVPAAVVAAGLMVGVANGAIPASITVSGTSFQVSADKLDGDGFVQYGGLAKKGDGSVVPVAVAGIPNATLTNLCQAVKVPGTTITLVLTAGKSTPVTASNLLINMTDLQGDAVFTNVSIGQDASTLTDGPSGMVGQAGGFGQQATHVTITNLKQETWYTSAGTFTLPGLHMAVHTDGTMCYSS